MNAQEIFKKEFTHSPRSQEDQDGALAALEYRSGERERIHIPYMTGTAQFDAFYCGSTEGHTLWNDHLEGRL